MKKVIHYLKYGNHNKNAFSTNYPEIHFENYNRFKDFTRFIFGLSITMFLLTFLIVSLKETRFMYFMIASISLFTNLINEFLMKKNYRLLNCLSYLFAMMLLFCLVDIYKTDKIIASSLICGLYIFLPIIIMDKLYRFHFIIVLCTISLQITCFSFQNFDTALLSSVNFYIHAVISILLSYYIYNFRMLHILEKCELTKGSDSDYLTGLKSRRALENYVDKFLKDGKNKSEETVLILLDLDNFKMVNDKFGHLVGDKVLKKVAKTLEEIYKNNSIISRVGGDEFVIFLSNIVSKNEVEKLVIETINKIDSISVKNTKQIGCSIGISYSETCKNYKTIFNKADIAMYQAKTNGKNRFETYQC